MASESTPLLTNNAGPINEDAIYKRFTPRKKLAILGMVSWCGLLPRSFVPLVPQISNDLNSSAEVISLAFSLAVFAAGLGSLGGGSYSTYYGRRPVYLVGLSLSTIGSLGMAASTSVPVLMIFRFCQTLGASPAMTVGAGVIGDIYAREQRGTAMGVFLAAILLGPTLAPLVGGLAAHYASWRVMQLCLCSTGAIAFLIMAAFFPETSHPNTGYFQKVSESPAHSLSRRWRFINPLAALWLLRSPVVLGISVSTTFILLTDFAILSPMAYTIGKRYGISNEAILGACFLPNGLGDIVGAPLAGRLSDIILAKSRKQRSGVWCPEDRIRGTLFSAATLVPISVLSFGLVNRYVGGSMGLTLTLICLFINGAGVQMVLGPTAAYLIDIMPSRSAETVAASTGFRSWMLAIILSGTLPLINSIGVTPTYSICAILSWIGFGMLWGIVRWGDRLRTWNDIGFNTSAL